MLTDLSSFSSKSVRRNPMQLQPVSSGRHASTTTARRRVLIVEDEALVAENLKDILTSKNYAVTGVAASGKEAIQRVNETTPDIILMDIRLRGDLDGIQTAIILQNTSAQGIPLIFVTAHSPQQFPHLSAIKPKYLYLTKPYSQEELLAAIDELLTAP